MSGEAARFWRGRISDLERQIQTCTNCGKPVYGNRPICPICNSKLSLIQVPHYIKTPSSKDQK
jgi:uncharacterized OB-fold protein